MSDLNHETVLETLKGVKFPRLSRDIVSFGIVKGIEIESKRIVVKINVASRDPNIPIIIEQDVTKALHAIAGAREIQVAMTWVQPESAPQTPMRDPHARPPSDQPLLPGVRTKIAVASGKGGVGKSTVAAGLAMMLQKLGHTVGLVDFDVYGPSVPTLMGVHTRARAFNNRILPIEHNGLKLMSMGFLVDPDTPMIWRGPMVHQATEQFLRDVEWGELDALIVDLPPGTGDAQMTLSQKINLDGAIIVSTPQDLALIDARKGAAMFEKLNVPILGIVENMSGFTCDHCGEITYIFGKGGAEAEARRLGVPLLAAIPLVPALVAASDAGDPTSAIEAHAGLRQQFLDIATRVADQIGLVSPAPLTR
ncbi:Mrp/NBP35 family ATP-binding protein [candidate division KSB1 bacterium]|nr:Mrp/NBP35 family ATP-binding protein [candidate division KSB1 bacterium]